jgi:hypothetical protein
MTMYEECRGCGDIGEVKVLGMNDYWLSNTIPNKAFY